jgi:hypothetical protein
MTDTSGGTAPGTEQPTGATDTTTTTPPAGAPENGAPAGQGVDTSGWSDDARTAYEKQQREIESLRRERGDERIQAKNNARAEGHQAAEQSITEKLLQALGVKEGGEAPTVEGLTQQVGAVTTERDTAARQAALYRAALDARIDPSKLEYVEFLLSKDATVAGISATDANLSGTIRTAIDTIVSKDATLRQSGTAQGSGVESHGGTGGADTITIEAFRGMNMPERAALREKNPDLYRRLADQA